MVPLLSYDEGRQYMQVYKAKESNYHAFGSDDMFQNERPQKKTLSDRLEGSKQVFGKIGSFFSNSVKSIVKTKDGNQDRRAINRRSDDTDEEEDEDNDTNNKFNNIGQDIKNISHKIGESFVNLGSRTKDFASQAGTYVKQKTNAIIKGQDQEVDESEIPVIRKEGDKYTQYFDNSGNGTTSGQRESKNDSKNEEEADVHFI